MPNSTPSEYQQAIESLERLPPITIEITPMEAYYTIGLIALANRYRGAVEPELLILAGKLTASLKHSSPEELHSFILNALSPLYNSKNK